MIALALAGAALLAGAGIVTALPRARRAGLAGQAAGAALLGAAGAIALLGGESAGGGFQTGVAPALGIDPLSGFFLVLLALTAVPTLIYARAYLTSGTLGALLAAFQLALALVLTARDAVTFLVGWELMTLVPAAAILTARRDAAVRAAVTTYVAITHLGGIGVWLALLALALPLAPTAPLALAALIGFGTKAGLVPLHSWLPRAHPVAPAPFSALMSGLMVKVALYGLIRVEFEWLGPPARWLGYALLSAGLLSALGGAVWALVQADLKRVLAYSTIENVGIVVTALGAAILIDDPVWAGVAFAAALLHIANHALFKTLLFLGAGALERFDLGRLGRAAFGIGCVAIAGLPPMNGFVSEWLTLQALARAELPGAVALAGIGMTAALSLLCFVTVAGLTLLSPRAPEPLAARELRAPLALLAGLCVAAALGAGALLPILARLAPGGVDVSIATLPMAALLGWLVLATALLVWARGTRRAAPAPSWACGQPLTPALQWTAAGFTKPLRLVLEAVLRPRRELAVVRSGGIVQRIDYVHELSSPADRLLYRPAIRAGLAGAAFTRRLQTGNVRTYAAYLLALVIGLLALVRLGALG